MVIDRFRRGFAQNQLLMFAALTIFMSTAALGIWFFWLKAPYEPLFSQLRTADAATIVAELDKQKIDYRLADGGATILVPSDKVDVTRLNVMGEDLPLKGVVGFEIFNKSDLGLTEFAQKINYQRALQGELARTIMTLENVADARVHLSLGQDRLFRDDRIPPKASVTIRMGNGIKLETARAEGIRKLISAAVPQLNVEDVVILDENGQAIDAPIRETAVGTRSPDQIERNAIEHYYVARIRKAIDAQNIAEVSGVSISIGTPLMGDDVQLSEWAPNSRSFPLNIFVESDLPPSNDMRDALNKIVQGAVSFDPALGDSVAFIRTSKREIIETRLAVPSIGSAQSADQAGLKGDRLVDGETGPWTLAVAIFAFFVIAILVALVRRQKVRTLSEDERAAFVRRLKIALDEDAENAR